MDFASLNTSVNAFVSIPFIERRSWRAAEALVSHEKLAFRKTTTHTHTHMYPEMFWSLLFNK